MKDIKLTNLFSQAWKIFKQNWGLIIVTFIVFAVISAIISSLDILLSIKEGTTLYYFINFLTFFLSLWVGMGFVKFLFNLVDDKKVCVKDLFSGASSVKHLISYFIITTLVSILIVLGYIAFIIPGLILSFGFYFIGLVAYENKFGIKDSIKYAWKLTRSYKWDIFLFWLMSIGIILLGLIPLGLGLFIAIPIVSIAAVVFYRTLQKIKETSIEEKVFEEETEEIINDFEGEIKETEETMGTDE